MAAAGITVPKKPARKKRRTRKTKQKNLELFTGNPNQLGEIIIDHLPQRLLKVVHLDHEELYRPSIASRTQDRWAAKDKFPQLLKVMRSAKNDCERWGWPDWRLDMHVSEDDGKTFRAMKIEERQALWRYISNYGG